MEVSPPSDLPPLEQVDTRRRDDDTAEGLAIVGTIAVSLALTCILLAVSFATPWLAAPLPG